MGTLEHFYTDYVKEGMTNYDNGERFDVEKIAGKTHFIIPITYITPNYLSIHALSLISALTNLGHKVSIVLHDNNFIIHQRVRRNLLSKNNTSLARYVEQILEEIELLLKVMGANVENVDIFKASDAWFACAQNKTEFFGFYSFLSEITFDLYSKDKNFYSGAHHIFQRPFDIYIAKNFSKLYKKDEGNPLFFITSSERAQAYTRLRDILSESTYTLSKGIQTPIILKMKHVPFISYNDNLPMCGNSTEEIKNILQKLDLKQTDYAELYKNIIMPLFAFFSKLGIRTTLIKKPKFDVEHISGYLYSILNSVASRTNSETLIKRKEIVIDSKLKFLEMSILLKSKAVLKVLACCNGEMTLSEIAKKTSMQLSNVSSYVNKLRGAGLVTTDTKPRTKFERIIINSESI
jgi:DNA-binding transcriptional ArsR family regulator